MKKRYLETKQNNEFQKKHKELIEQPQYLGDVPPTVMAARRLVLIPLQFSFNHYYAGFKGQVE